jgi:hypothetical protein
MTDRVSAGLDRGQRTRECHHAAEPAA